MGKNLYCTFVDFKKAFDTIWRVGLWQKLIKNNITGKLLKVIYNMYDSIKSCVKFNNNISGFFSCDIGVRQGENLSPFLFSIFLSDLENFFIQNNIRGLHDVANNFEEHLRMFVLIFVLLYADDTIILAESVSDIYVYSLKTKSKKSKNFTKALEREQLFADNNLRTFAMNANKLGLPLQYLFSATKNKEELLALHEKMVVKKSYPTLTDMKMELLKGNMVVIPLHMNSLNKAAPKQNFVAILTGYSKDGFFMLDYRTSCLIMIH